MARLFATRYIDVDDCAHVESVVIDFDRITKLQPDYIGCNGTPCFRVEYFDEHNKYSRYESVIYINVNFSVF